MIKARNLLNEIIFDVKTFKYQKPFCILIDKCIKFAFLRN